MTKAAIKTPVKASKKQAKKPTIKSVVKDHFNSGVSLDDTALALTNLGVKFSEIQKTIQKIGLDNDWILTDEKIQKEVKSIIKGKPITHFLDVQELAQKLQLPQLSEAEKQKAITEFSGISKSISTPSKKFKQFNNSGYMGTISAWIREHPDFTHDELYNAGLIPACPNKEDYFEEFLAYQSFFKELAS